MSAKQALMIPMYMLYYIDDVTSFDGFDPAQLETISETYTAAELADIADAVIWACDNPELDLTDLLPDLPHNNAAIHEYLARIKSAFERPPLLNLLERAT